MTRQVHNRVVPIIAALVAVFAVVTIVVALVTLGNDHPPQSSPPTSTEGPRSSDPAPAFALDQCVQGLGERDEPVRGSCDDGGSPYRIVRISTRCAPTQASFVVGKWTFCLTPNLNTNYCYRIPDEGYIATARCRDPGAVLVVDVLPGLYTDEGERPSCTSDAHWDTYYSWRNPPLTVCVEGH